MAHILLLYSTTDGHTLKISQRLREGLEASGHAVALVAIEDADSVDPRAFDTIVIGAGIRYGKHNPRVAGFIRRHAALLAGKPSAFFSVNLVARKPGKDRPDTNPYLRKFLRGIAWQPRELAVFAGKLDYPRYGLADRWIIRLIMLITGGPTDPAAVVEYTDWDAVEAFGRRIADLKNPA